MKVEAVVSVEEDCRKTLLYNISDPTLRQQYTLIDSLSLTNRIAGVICTQRCVMKCLHHGHPSRDLYEGSPLPGVQPTKDLGSYIRPRQVSVESVSR